jgi:hypothetical protein
MARIKNSYLTHFFTVRLESSFDDSHNTTQYGCVKYLLYSFVQGDQRLKYIVDPSVRAANRLPDLNSATLLVLTWQ